MQSVNILEWTPGNLIADQYEYVEHLNAVMGQFDYIPSNSDDNSNYNDGDENN